MGAVCCCLRAEDYEDYINPNSQVYRNCMCLRCFVQNFLNVYTSIFQRGDAYQVPSSIQGGASTFITSPSNDDSISSTYHAPPRPLPYNVDPRCFRLQPNGLVSRREKGSSHSHEESEPLRRNDINAETESLSKGDKWKGSVYEEGSKDNLMRSSLKSSSVKTNEAWSMYTSSEEEDVCPTCLEEYTPENPKIMTKCAHHYHLGCIYEWMERSENCPVCGKVMVFDETS